MSRLRVTATEVYVQMHWLERLGTLYWRAAPRAPRNAITSVRIVRPTQGNVEVLIEVPFMMNFGVPGRLNTTVPKARTSEDEPAFAATRRWVPALVVEFDTRSARWARWVISDRDATSLARELANR